MSPTRAQLCALGRVSYEYAALESAVRACISKLISDDPSIGRIVGANLGMRNSLDILDGLVRYRLGGSRTARRVLAAVQAASEASDQRNAVVHSSWWISLGPGRSRRVRHALIRTSARKGKGLKSSGGLTNARNLDRIAGALHRASLALFKVEARLDSASVADPPPWASGLR